VRPTGTIKIPHPDVDVWEMEESCALDLAERDGMTGAAIGAILNVSRERIRQIESEALVRLREVPILAQVTRESDLMPPHEMPPPLPKELHFVGTAPSPALVAWIRQAHRVGCTVADMAEQYGLSVSDVRKMVTRSSRRKDKWVAMDVAIQQTKQRQLEVPKRPERTGYQMRRRHAAKGEAVGSKKFDDREAVTHTIDGARYTIQPTALAGERTWVVIGAKGLAGRHFATQAEAEEGLTGWLDRVELHVEEKRTKAEEAPKQDQSGTGYYPYGITPPPKPWTMPWGKRHRYLGPAKDYACKLREAGATYDEINEIVGTGQGVVARWIKQAEKPTPRRAAPEADDMAKAKAGHVAGLETEIATLTAKVEGWQDTLGAWDEVCGDTPEAARSLSEADLAKYLTRLNADLERYKAELEGWQETLVEFSGDYAKREPEELTSDDLATALSFLEGAYRTGEQLNAWRELGASVEAKTPEELAEVLREKDEQIDHLNAGAKGRPGFISLSAIPTHRPALHERLADEIGEGVDFRTGSATVRHRTKVTDEEAERWRQQVLRLKQERVQERQAVADQAAQITRLEVQLARERAKSDKFIDEIHDLRRCVTGQAAALSRGWGVS
jgi:hypothetical protein